MVRAIRSVTNCLGRGQSQRNQRGGLDLDGLRSDPAGRSAALTRIRRIPGGSRSGLGVVGYVLVWDRADAGAGKERIDFGVERVEPCDFALELLGFFLQLPHPLLVRDLPPMFFYLQLLLSPIELDLSQLVVDDGSPVQHR